MIRSKVKMISIDAIGIALVYIASTLLHINIASSNPNLGDAIIFVFSLCFGPITGMIVGSVGSFLADLVIFPATCVFSFIIKGLEGLVVGLIGYNKKNTFIHVIACILGSVIMVSLYFLCKAFIYGNLQTAIVSIYSNLVQAILSIIIGIIIYKIIEKNKLLEKIEKKKVG